MAKNHNKFQRILAVILTVMMVVPFSLFEFGMTSSAATVAPDKTVDLTNWTVYGQSGFDEATGSAVDADGINAWEDAAGAVVYCSDARTYNAAGYNYNASFLFEAKNKMPVDGIKFNVNPANLLNPEAGTGDNLALGVTSTPNVNNTPAAGDITATPGFLNGENDVFIVLSNTALAPGWVDTFTLFKGGVQVGDSVVLTPATHDGYLLPYARNTGMTVELKQNGENTVHLTIYAEMGFNNQGVREINCDFTAPGLDITGITGYPVVASTKTGNGVNDIGINSIGLGNYAAGSNIGKSTNVSAKDYTGYGKITYTKGENWPADVTIPYTYENILNGNAASLPNPSQTTVTADGYYYTFLGWFDGDTRVPSLLVNGDKNLVGKWSVEQAYTVNFDFNCPEGECLAGPGLNHTIYNTQIVTPGQFLNISAINCRYIPDTTTPCEFYVQCSNYTSVLGWSTTKEKAQKGEVDVYVYTDEAAQSANPNHIYFDEYSAGYDPTATNNKTLKEIFGDQHEVTLYACWQRVIRFEPGNGAQYTLPNHLTAFGFTEKGVVNLGLGIQYPKDFTFYAGSMENGAEKNTDTAIQNKISSTYKIAAIDSDFTSFMGWKWINSTDTRPETTLPSSYYKNYTGDTYIANIATSGVSGNSSAQQSGYKNYTITKEWFDDYFPTATDMHIRGEWLVHRVTLNAGIGGNGVNSHIPFTTGNGQYVDLIGGTGEHLSVANISERESVGTAIFNVYRNDENTNGIGRDTNHLYYWFYGWNTKIDGTGTWVSQLNDTTVSQLDVGPDGYPTLYAVWYIPPRTVVYHPNGGFWDHGKQPFTGITGTDDTTKLNNTPNGNINVNDFYSFPTETATLGREGYRIHTGLNNQTYVRFYTNKEKGTPGDNITTYSPSSNTYPGGYGSDTSRAAYNNGFGYDVWSDGNLGGSRYTIDNTEAYWYDDGSTMHLWAVWDPIVTYHLGYKDDETYKNKVDTNGNSYVQDFNYVTAYTLGGNGNIVYGYENNYNVVRTDNNVRAPYFVLGTERYGLTMYAGTRMYADRTVEYSLTNNLRANNEGWNGAVQIKDRPGYTLKGWASSYERAQQGIIDYNAKTVLKDSVYQTLDLYAVWEENPVLTYHLSNGTVVTEGLLADGITKIKGASFKDYSGETYSKDYPKGSEVTLLTSDKVLCKTCKFMGWYLTPDFSGSPITNIASLTTDTDVYAKWLPYTLFVRGTDFTVKIGSASQKTFVQKYDEVVDFNTPVVVNYTGSETFYCWTNGRDKVLSTSKNFTYDFYSVSILKAVTSSKDDNSGAYKYVVFMSYDNQVMKSELYKAGETVVFPTAADMPTKLGWTFSGWDKTAAEINMALSGSDNAIVVTAQYEKNNNTYIAKFNTNKGQTVKELAIGESWMVDADDPTFSYWTDASGAIVSYNPVYTVRKMSTGEVEFTANYNKTGYTVTALLGTPETNRTIDPNTGKKKISFTSTVNIPSDWTCVEMGMLYTTKAAYSTDTALQIDKLNIYKYKSEGVFESGSGTITMNLSTSSSRGTIYARCYVICKDASGNYQHIYSNIANCYVADQDGIK